MVGKNKKSLGKITTRPMAEEKNSKLPEFFCIGVAKAGTTTVHHALLSHPQIFLPKIKETFFFSADNEYRKGTEWYLENYFSSARKHMVRGEIAATYLYHGEKVAQRFVDTYGDNLPKLIVLFRDPVQRAYSQYWHMKRLGLERLAFREALALEDARRPKGFKKNAKNGKDWFAYFENGLYARNLQPFLDKVERKQFLFLLFDDLVQEYDVVMNDILSFIGVSQIDLPRERQNEARIAENSHTMLWHRSPTSTKSLIRKVTPARLRHKIGKLIGLNSTRLFQYPPMEKDLEAELRERFKTENIRLSEIINKDLSNWLPKS